MGILDSLFGRGSGSKTQKRKFPKGNCPKCKQPLKTSPVPGEEGMYRLCKQCGALYHRECAAGGDQIPSCICCGGSHWQWEFV
jgi:hypothetical protein